MVGLRRAHGVAKVVVVSLREAALLLQQGQDAHLALEQREGRRVGHVPHLLPRHALRRVLALLQVEDDLVELALQLLEELVVRVLGGLELVLWWAGGRAGGRGGGGREEARARVREAAAGGGERVGEERRRTLSFVSFASRSPASMAV